MTLSAYAQIASMAQAALNDPAGVTLHVTLAMAGTMEDAHRMARSYQITFTSWRASLRRKLSKGKYGAPAETPFDVLTTRLRKAPGGDGWTVEIFKPHLDAFEIPVTSLSTGLPVSMSDGRRMANGARYVVDHPEYARFDLLSQQQELTEADQAFIDSVWKWAAPPTEAKPDGRPAHVEAFEAAQDAIAKDADDRLAEEIRARKEADDEERKAKEARDAHRAATEALANIDPNANPFD